MWWSILPVILMASATLALIPSSVLFKLKLQKSREYLPSEQAQSNTGTCTSTSNLGVLGPIPVQAVLRMNRLKVSASPVMQGPPQEEGPKIQTHAVHTNSSKKSKSKKQANNYTGNSANVYWRSIPMDDLRSHPLYRSLGPFPDTTTTVGSISPQDYWRFPQDTFEWDMLHTGRLTTSIAAACLGFYEPSNANYLKIPRSLTSHGRSLQAYERLLDTPLTQLDLGAIPSQYRYRHKAPTRTAWRINTSNQTNVFPYQYIPTALPLGQARGISSMMSARLAWGSAQEAVAILVAINYFHHHQQAVIEEIGLCPLECISSLPTQITSWLADGTLPHIGASPDGLIRYPDGTTEVLEVKCSSPFQSTRDTRRHNHTMEIRRSIHKGSHGVATWHIAQLQLEILCAGPSCKGAVLVALTATEGASIYRIPRDDAYILQMLSWIRVFYMTFQLHASAPKEDFLSPATPDYGGFLDATARLASSAATVARISQEQVQRSSANGKFFI